jgi:hypothetical protein
MSFFDNKYLAIQIGDVEIDISRATNTTTTPNITTLVSVIQASDEEAFSITDILTQELPSETDLIALIPNIKVKDLLIAKVAPTQAAPNTKVSYVISATFGATIDLSALPIFDKFLPPGVVFGLQGCQLCYATQAISVADCTVINQLLPNGISPLPIYVQKGINVTATLIVDNTTFLLTMKDAPHASTTQTGSTSQQTTTSAVQDPTKANSGGVTPVNKQLGPINISSIGLQLTNGNLNLIVSGGFNVGPLGLEFMGFEVSTPLDAFNPTVTLHGLSVNVNKPPLTIDGLFEHSSTSIPWQGSTATIDQYTGSLTIGYNAFSLAAFGSYTTLPDDTSSLFLYGFLGAPLGGPPVCFITGVAAGFGFNRTLTLPTPSTISQHALLAPVLGGANDFNSLNQDFLPAEGAYWGAVGVRAESFKMITSFVLLVIQFYKQLEIDLIGTSDMIFPIPKDGDSTPPLANINIGIVARIIPEQGVMSISGAFLPGSYVFNPNASISGGFALLTIFKDQVNGFWAGAQEGDFVVTIGGYAPSYQPPSYYPQVSRLEMNWQVSSDLSLKAESYFAITPQALMAGGYLRANFNSGGDLSIRVHFKVGADFIIYWKPYHYSGDMYADLSVTAALSIDLFFFTLHVSVDFDLSADLTIWGPSFSGNASVRVHVLISFTVSISFGENYSAPTPIGWDEFSKGFLPAPDKILTLNISKGIIASASNQSLNVVNPKELQFTCSTLIPLRNVQIGSLEVTSIEIKNGSFGINPMGMTASDFSASLMTISIIKDGEVVNSDYINSHFTIEPIYKNMPAALWEAANTSGQLNESTVKTLITDLLAGIQLTAHEPTPGKAFTVPANKVDLIATKPASEAPSFNYSTNNFKAQS